MKLRILIALFHLAMAGFILLPKCTAGPHRPRVGDLLAMNGSDGISRDGMYHEEHALPSFVHARARTNCGCGCRR